MTDAQRRARLVARHHLARTAVDVDDAVRGVAALHATDPVAPHLGLWARVPDYRTEHLDEALCGARRLWRLHAMRRTLFIVPTDEGAIFDGAAGRAVARKERRRVEQWLQAELGPADVPAWLTDLERRAVAAVSACGECGTSEVAAAVPELATKITVGSGAWATRSPLSSRLLFLLAMERRIVRTRPAGSWRSSQYRWAVADEWFGPVAEPMEEAAAQAALARRYLTAFGPVTTTDLRWWTGWTARQAAAALEANRAVAVALDDGGDGWVRPDDVDDVDGPGLDASTVALLPGLDPTPMGWKERGWFLGGFGERLFDRNGNVGPTVWAGGRIVGGWSQRPDGQVVTRLLADVGAVAARRVDAEAAALTAWLDGTVVSSRFPVPLERELSAS